MNSKWANKETIMHNSTCIGYNDEVKRSGMQMMYDKDHLYINDKGRHSLIIGATGSGKTQTTMLPPIKLGIKAGESMVINDIKGECYERLSGELKKEGYKVYALDFINFKKGNKYNPFTIPYDFYKNGDKDKALDMLETIGHYLIAELKETNSDPFWDISAINLFTGLVLYLFENAKEEEINLSSVVNLANSIGKLTKEVENLNKTSLIYTYLSQIISAPEETKGSILATFKQKINLYVSREGITRITSATDMDIKNIQQEKTAIFLIGENKATAKSLISLIIDQCSYVANVYNNKERRLNFYLDDFENLKAMKDFVTVLNLSRGNNIVFNLYIKSLTELNNIYGKEQAMSIRISVSNMIYLLANDMETLEEISKLCGTKDDKTPLITPEELKTLDNFEAIILIPRIAPIRTKLLPDYEIKWDFETKPVELKEIENKELNIFSL